MNDWDDMPRPFFGEVSETVGATREPMTRGTHVRAGTYEQHRQWRIQEGICPRPACGTELEDNACRNCGWSLVEEQMRERVKAKEQPADWLPRLPGALFLDEYAPADTEEAA